MVRGGCKRCGDRTSNNRLCNTCQKLRDRGFFATASDRRDDDGDDFDEDLEYRCTNCGEEYVGSKPCPECEARRRRYIGPLSGEERVATDGGQTEHRADCNDCAWSFEDSDFGAVADAAEDHIISEVGHEVDVERGVATDGGAEIPEPLGWPYDAVVHGADVDEKCLAITGSGDCCTNNAYGDTLCGMHEDATDPDILEGAHQWARIKDGDVVIAVCVNCEEVWKGGTPALAVDCPECPAGVAERCRDPDSMTAARLMPHPERRERGRDLLDEYEYCSEAPIPAVDDDQKRLVTDGGRDQEEVLDVLGEVEPCQEIEAMKGLLQGMTDEESLSLADWFEPMKRTDGQICLEIGDALGSTYFTHVRDDLFGQLPHTFEFDRPATLPEGHVAAVIDAHPDVTPVLRENTPFADAPPALRWEVRCKNEDVVDDPRDAKVEASYTDREEARAEAIRLARARDIDYGVWDAHEEEFAGRPTPETAGTEGSA